MTSTAAKRPSPDPADGSLVSLSTAPHPTSLFVNGAFPRRRGLILLLCLAGGFLLTWLWNAELVDREIGFSVADGVLGRDAHATPIGGIAGGILFALVTGVAGSFTACNVAAFGALGPMLGLAGSRTQRALLLFKPLGWLAVGTITVSAGYGAIVGLVGTRMPQFSTATTPAGHLSPRSIQSMIAFGTIGLVMLILGLAALGFVGDPLAAVSRRWPNAPLVLMGALIGAFLIGRPYPLFRDMFRHAATSHNPLYGAAAFTLQSLGNILVMAIVFAVIALFFGGRVGRWLTEKPSRAATLTAVAFLVAAVFMLLYWDVRALSRIGVLWFPPSPWT